MAVYLAFFSTCFYKLFLMRQCFDSWQTFFEVTVKKKKGEVKNAHALGLSALYAFDRGTMITPPPSPTIEQLRVAGN